MRQRNYFQFFIVIVLTTLFCIPPTISYAQNVAPQKNAFAERPLIHVLGPSPALSPNLDPSAVDSRMLESCDIFKDLDTYYWYYHARSQDQERWPNGYRVCVATSPNIMGPWKRYKNNPILDHGKEGEWDSGSVDCVVLLKEGAYDLEANTEKYYMTLIKGKIPKSFGYINKKISKYFIERDGQFTNLVA